MPPVVEAFLLSPACQARQHDIPGYFLAVTSAAYLLVKKTVRQSLGGVGQLRELFH